MDLDAKDGKLPGGKDNWYTRVWEKKRPIFNRNQDANNTYYKFIIPRTAEFKRNKWLILERVKDLVIG